MMYEDFEPGVSFAIEEDKADVLSVFREKFYVPKKRGQEVIYFCGNSLGLQPVNAAPAVREELNNWRARGVEGHFYGVNPWVSYSKKSKKGLSELVGAKESEVVCMNNLTTNLHLLLASFYRPEGARKKILIEKGAFPSDHFAVSSFIQILGQDPKECLVEMTIPEDGYLSTQQITETISTIGAELALVMLPGVQYYTGQFFDIASITAAAHKVGAYAGFDLAHAIGNLPMSLHQDKVDFATWCSYKYLNSGPGNVSGIYIHEKHGNDPDFPRLAGWWGHNDKTRFQMKNEFDPMPGADGWQLSNMNIIPTAIHHESLKIFQEAGIDRLRKKSVRLTSYLHYLLETTELIKSNVKIITPANPEERGCQLSLFLPNHGKEIFEFLIDNGVVLDWREPNVIRVAPTPLYNSYQEVFNFCNTLMRAFRKNNG